MDNVSWADIRTHYEMAKKHLWCPKHSSGWHRDEVEGMFHLWNAYHAAVSSSEKEDLIYARILMMMFDEQHAADNYTRFHQYVSPAMDAYDRAIADGNTPTEKEYAKAKALYESLKYELEHTSDTLEQYEKAYTLIDGLNEVPEFEFHDSKPVYFEHTSDRAVLKLEYHELTLTLEFEDPVEIEVNTDPVCDWICDFYCYPMYHDSKLIQFNVGFYRILCKAVRVIDVKRSDHQHN